MAAEQLVIISKLLYIWPS